MNPTLLADFLPPTDGHLSHGAAIVFLFALGACVGSFLNVVVWRLPQGKSLVWPPSHCPKCGKNLKWYDNVPILGWIKLGGKCRFCKLPISPRYPTVELVTALIFVLYYMMYYMIGYGPVAPVPTLRYADAPSSIIYFPPGWPILLLHLFAVSCLLAAGLIDAERYEIPWQITVLLALVALGAHAIYDEPRLTGALSAVRADFSISPTAALGAGGAVGLLLSMALRKLDIFKQSFPYDDSEVGVELEGRTVGQFFRQSAEGLARTPARLISLPARLPALLRDFLLVRKPLVIEIGKEILFLLPPICFAVSWWLLTAYVPSVHAIWNSFVRQDWAAGLMGALFGGLVGGFIIWLTRILGTLAFGKIAMGLGDVDLMFAVGATIGPMQAAVAFFLAPFFGIFLALYYLVTGKKNELPFGPYLAIASAVVMFIYGPIAEWLSPGLTGLGYMVHQWVSGEAG